jgi:raffinose/stachyose/melibiose transport system permease protein
MATVLGLRAADSAPRRRRGPGAGPAARTLRRDGSPGAYFVALIVLAVTLAPLLFVVIDGFRTSAQINTSPTALPSPWVWSNYSSILGSSVYWQLLENSVLIAVVATALAVGLGSMAAFALSRYRFRGREGFYSFFVTGLLFPANVAALPLYLLLRDIGLLESPLGVALPEAAFSITPTILILRPLMRAIPAELEDAAALDGSTRLGFFWRVVLPLSGPGLATVGVLAFVTSWNAYLLPLLVFSNPQHFTLPLGVASFQTQYSQDPAAIMAFTALSMVPALIFLIVAQRQLVAGFTGAVKG